MAGFSRFFAAFCASAICLAAHAGLSLEECKRQAAKGDPEAAYQLGVRYEAGDGVRQDRLRALANYRKAADKGHREACGKLAGIYEEGKWVSKDKVLAAKYRAMSAGQSGDAAAASAKERMEKENVDEIEVALDYIIGRNGKKRDAKAGIRLLYAAAKDKPVAQRVFVQRWEKGDLDDGLETIGDEEWGMVVPWFRAQFDSGRFLKGGQVLGNEAYRRKDYGRAATYWEAAGKAGSAKSWFYLGELLNPANDEKSGGAPKYFHNESKARRAYENCLRLWPNHERANHALGLVCLFGEKRNRNAGKAFEIFSRLVKLRKDDKWYLYDYGLAGCLVAEEEFSKKWPDIDKAIKRFQGQYGDRYKRSSEYKRLNADYDRLVSLKEKYMESIRKAADLGCKPAERLLVELAK